MCVVRFIGLYFFDSIYLLLGPALWGQCVIPPVVIFRAIIYSTNQLSSPWSQGWTSSDGKETNVSFEIK